MNDDLFSLDTAGINQNQLSCDVNVLLLLPKQANRVKGFNRTIILVVDMLEGQWQ